MGLVRLRFCPKNRVRWQLVAGECEDDDRGHLIEGVWITWSREVAHASACVHGGECDDDRGHVNNLVKGSCAHASSAPYKEEHVEWYSYHPQNPKINGVTFTSRLSIVTSLFESWSMVMWTSVPIFFCKPWENIRIICCCLFGFTLPIMGCLWIYWFVPFEREREREARLWV